MLTELTEAELQEYDTNGFIIIKEIINSLEVEKLNTKYLNCLRACEAEIEADPIQGSILPKIGTVDSRWEARNEKLLFNVSKNSTDELLIERIAWVGGFDPYFFELSRNDKILTAVKQILGAEEVIHFFNQLHLKKPGSQFKQKWHQDGGFRRYDITNWPQKKEGHYIGVLIAIDTCTIDNGPLCILPGSHKYGLLADIKHARSISTNSLQKKYMNARELNVNESQCPVVLEKGDAVIIDERTLHCSTKNESLESRCILLNGYSSFIPNEKFYDGDNPRISLLHLKPKLLLKNIWVTPDINIYDDFDDLFISQQPEIVDKYETTEDDPPYFEEQSCAILDQTTPVLGHAHQNEDNRYAFYFNNRKEFPGKLEPCESRDNYASYSL